ncbi:MAG: putative rane protein [Frankiales bacterium]|nr:putative rane protein [Frankiales bacterium]
MAVQEQQQRSRLSGVDVARGVALLGMMAVHVFPEERPDGSTSLVHVLVSGRAAALFAVLAGVGLALLTRREAPGQRTSVALRALVVAFVGLVLGAVDSGLAVILAYYGVLFLVALPLLRLPARVLAAASLAFALLGPLLSFALRPSLPPRAPGNPTVDLLLLHPWQLVTTLLVTGYYPVLCWGAYLCAGLAVGRLDLRSRVVQVRLALGGAVLAAAASAASWLLLDLRGADAIAATDPSRGLGDNQFGNVPTSTPWWLAVDAPHASTPPDLLLTTGTSLLVLGLALLVCTRPVVARLLRPLAAAGSMTLTLYVVHVVVVAATSGGSPALLWSVQVVAFWLFAVGWLRLFPRGPLETVVAEASRR